VIFVLRNGNITTEMLLSYTPKNKWLAALVILLLFALKSQTVIILYAVVATATGVIFDLPTALAVNTAGTVICISIPYFIGRGSGGVLVQSLFKKSAKLQKIYEENQDNTFLASLIMRALNLSNDLLGLFFGSLRVPYFEYLASSFIGIVPAMVLYTVLGTILIFCPRLFLVCSALELLSIVAAWLLLRMKKRKKRTMGRSSFVEKSHQTRL
jgi:uncharacterized membrane protein YdjX (TVP38/TMEM64 family)